MILHLITTCLFGFVCRFQSMSITILRSYSIELLIRQNAINLALRNTIFLMRSLAEHHYSPSFSHSSWYMVHTWWASCWLPVRPVWVVNISPKLEAAGTKISQSHGVMKISHHVCFHETEPFLFLFLLFSLLHSIITCLVYRFRSMSIPIQFRSYGIELLINRLWDVITPALPNAILITRSLTQWHSLSFSSWSAIIFWDIWWAKVVVKIYCQSCWILKEKRKKSALKPIQPI